MIRFKQQKGFTLIELLIVIAIIGILTALITPNLTALQARGRDTQRKAGLETIRTALEKYYDDNNSYPETMSLNTANTAFAANSITYATVLPTDPRNSGNFIYHYCVSPVITGTTYRTSYRLFARLENTRDADRYCKNSTSNFNDCLGNTTGFTCSPSTPLNTITTNSNYMVREP